MDAHVVSPVLLVEDNPDDVLIMKIAWKKRNIKTPLITVDNGEKALMFLNKQEEYKNVPTPCLILLDLKMPIVDGFEVLETIKSDHSLKNIPVIILTSSERENDFERASKLGCHNYIVKPTSFDDFIKIIDEINQLLVKIKQHAPF